MKCLFQLNSLLGLFMFVLSIQIGFCQVAINEDGTIPDPSSVLDLKSSNKGFLPPRIIVLDSIINPAAGLMIYDVTHSCMRYYNGESWSQCMGKPFQCNDPIMDERDGKTYNTRKIGGQCWMTTNLNYGDLISGSVLASDNSTIEKYCYENDEANCDIYGGLYTWNELMNYETTEGGQGICPSGWHVPTDEEYKTLEIELGMTVQQANSGGFRGTDQGSRLSGFQELWLDGALKDEPDFGVSGFNFLPGGALGTNNTYSSVQFRGDLWSSTEFNEFLAWHRIVYHYTTIISRGGSNKGSTGSVRCLKD